MSNPFLEALADRPEGRSLIGMWSTLADAYALELCAGAGFDWITIDAEHSPNDVRTILAQLQAVDGLPVAPLVRPAIGETHVLKTLMDIGAQSFVIPMVESGEQAAELVRAVRYPPRGVRGVGYHAARASRWSRDATYAEHADEDICLVLQIETTAGLAAVDDIARTDGVTAVFVGPSDLSASLGHFDDPAHPAVQDAIASVLRAGHDAGKAVGTLETQRDVAHRRVDEGFDFVAVGVDAALLANATSALVDDFR